MMDISPEGLVFHINSAKKQSTIILTLELGKFRNIVMVMSIGLRNKDYQIPMNHVFSARTSFPINCLSKI
jgi:hypothetical protein